MMTSEAKQRGYADLRVQVGGLFEQERDGLANAANLSAVLFTSLPRLNWAGFYFRRGEELVLGPFQGRPACVRIAWGRGVCGSAAQRRETLIVPDVHDFPGHIACDAASRSEIVIPLRHGDRVVGVLDLDSPDLARFDPTDAAGLETLAELWSTRSELGRLID